MVQETDIEPAGKKYGFVVGVDRQYLLLRAEGVYGQIACDYQSFAEHPAPHLQSDGSRLSFAEVYADYDEFEFELGETCHLPNDAQFMARPGSVKYVGRMENQSGIGAVRTLEHQRGGYGFIDSPRGQVFFTKSVANVDTLHTDYPIGSYVYFDAVRTTRATKKRWRAINVRKSSVEEYATWRSQPGLNSHVTSASSAPTTSSSLITIPARNRCPMANKGVKRVFLRNIDSENHGRHQLRHELMMAMEAIHAPVHYIKLKEVSQHESYGWADFRSERAAENCFAQCYKKERVYEVEWFVDLMLWGKKQSIYIAVDNEAPSGLPSGASVSPTWHDTSSNRISSGQSAMGGSDDGQSNNSNHARLSRDTIVQQPSLSRSKSTATTNDANQVFEGVGKVVNKDVNNQFGFIGTTRGDVFFTRANANLSPADFGKQFPMGSHVRFRCVPTSSNFKATWRALLVEPATAQDYVDWSIRAIQSASSRQRDGRFHVSE